MQRGVSLKRVTASPTNHPSFFEHLQACATKHRHSLLIVTFPPSNNQTDPQTVCASATPEGSVGNSCSVTCQRRTSPVVQITCELRQSFDTGTQVHLNGIAGLHLVIPRVFEKRQLRNIDPSVPSWEDPGTEENLSSNLPPSLHSTDDHSNQNSPYSAHCRFRVAQNQKSGMLRSSGP